LELPAAPPAEAAVASTAPAWASAHRCQLGSAGAGTAAAMLGELIACHKARRYDRATASGTLLFTSIPTAASTAVCPGFAAGGAAGGDANSIPSPNDLRLPPPPPSLLLLPFGFRSQPAIRHQAVRTYLHTVRTVHLIAHRRHCSHRGSTAFNTTPKPPSHLANSRTRYPPGQASPLHPPNVAQWPGPLLKDPGHYPNNAVQLAATETP
jgi:hypothetical protein